MMVGVSMISCDFFKKGGGGTTTDEPDTLQYQTFSYKDSLTLTVDSIEGEANIEQCMFADFPVPEATGPLADSIRAWLVLQLCQNYSPSWEEAATPESLGITYQVGEEQTFINVCASAGMKKMTDEVQELSTEGLLASYSNDCNVSVSVNTPKYVTYDVGYYVYSGGAHGGYLSFGQTFRCSDGRRMGWNMIDPAKHPQLVKLLTQELCEYFAADTEDKHTLSEQELWEHLLLYDDPDTPENELELGLPLPHYAPYLTEDGMAFVYQQYEIAAYACGMPGSTIPYDRIKPLLTEWAKKMLPK